MSYNNIPFTGLTRQYTNLREEILHTTDLVLQSGQLMDGAYTTQFEDWLAKKNNVDNAITCHSGTNALEILACYWAQEESINPPTVLIPSVTYVATANAFIRAGWDVFFVDVDKYGLLDMDKVPESLSYQAVVFVGLYGASVVHQTSVKHWQKWLPTDVTIIEDAAQHWLSADCRRIGQGAAISFDPMKNLACYGNGGAVLTDNPELTTFAKNFRNNGKATNHLVTGSNCRMSELDCATMLVKTKYIDHWQERRRTVAWQYMQGFKDTNLRCLIDDTNFHDHAFHKFVIDVDNRQYVQAELARKGIETKFHYQYAVSDHSAYRQYPAPDMLGACYALTRRVLSLPIYPELTDNEVDYIIKSVLEVV